MDKPLVDSEFGLVQRGSVISYQQPKLLTRCTSVASECLVSSMSSHCYPSAVTNGELAVIYGDGSEQGSILAHDVANKDNLKI